MVIYEDGREYISIPYTADFTPASVEVEVDGVWYPAVAVGPPATLLVAGPAATGNPPGTVVLAVGTYYLRVRFTDAPEIMVMGVPGRIDVVAAPSPTFIPPC